jgi:hypothetical protein
MVPAANGGISKTPIGPFHTTVFASQQVREQVRVAGPMSSPIRSPIAGSSR